MGPLQTATEALFDAAERRDTEGTVRSFAADAQGIDEITRRWVRGRNQFAEYVRELFKDVDEIHTRLADVHELVHGEFGLLTCWIEQDYVLKGVPTHVSAPTTCVFQREGTIWKMVLFHSLPLPPGS